jgi:RNA polymerase sigma factor (sigma-70 family)
VQPAAGPTRVGAVTVIARAVHPSFDDVYAAHYAEIVGLVQANFGDRQDAHDVVQEAFYRALVRWDAVAGYDDPAAWIRRVAWNLAVSRWRRARAAIGFLHRQRRVEPQSDGPGPDRVALTAALGTLPAAHRRALVMHYLADMPVAEIAEHEGVAAGTVKSWLYRGRAALAAALAVLAVAALIAVFRTEEQRTLPASTVPTYPDSVLVERIGAALGGDDNRIVLTQLDQGPQALRKTLTENGTYTLEVICYGSGSLDLGWNTTALGAAPLSTLTTLPCDTTMRSTPVTLTVPAANAFLSVEINAHVAGPGQAAFGFRLDKN